MTATTATAKTAMLGYWQNQRVEDMAELKHGVSNDSTRNCQAGQLTPSTRQQLQSG